MQTYFESYLKQIKNRSDCEGLSFGLPIAEVSNIYIPGRGGGQGSSPEIRPYLTIQHNITSDFGQLEILMGANLPITEEQKAAGRAGYSSEGVREAIEDVYQQQDYVPLASYIKGSPELSNHKMSLLFKPSKETVKVAFPQFDVGDSSEPNPKVYSPLHVFQNKQFDESLDDMFSLLTGKMTVEDFYETAIKRA